MGTNSMWGQPARYALDSSGNVTGLVGPDGTELSLGGASKFVSFSSAGASCASGVATAQPITASNLLDTHSLVDSINGTVLIPTDATHLSIGLRSQPVWGSTAGTYRAVGAEFEIFAGVWVLMTEMFAPVGGLTSGPTPGPILEMGFVDAAWKGKKMRFTTKQDSGGAITPTNLAFYAQFLTLP